MKKKSVINVKTYQHSAIIENVDFFANFPGMIPGKGRKAQGGTRGTNGMKRGALSKERIREAMARRGMGFSSPKPKILAAFLAVMLLSRNPLQL